MVISNRYVSLPEGIPYFWGAEHVFFSTIPWVTRGAKKNDDPLKNPIARPPARNPQILAEQRCLQHGFL